MQFRADSVQPGARSSERFAGWLVDAAAILLTYVTLLSAWERPVRQMDLLLACAMLALASTRLAWSRTFSPGALLRTGMRWGLLLLLMGGLVAWAAPWGGYGVGLGERAFLVVWVACSYIVMAFTRLLSPWVARVSGRMAKARRVVIVGLSDVALQLGGAIAGGRCKGQRLMGYFDDRAPDRVPGPSWAHRLGGLADVGEFVKRHRIDCIYIALPVTSAPRVMDLLHQTQETTASVYLVPNLIMEEVIQCRVSLFAGVPTVAVCESPLNGGAGVLKRVLDVTLTLAATPVLVPLMGLIAVLVKLTSRGPVLFKQRRYGLDGQEIVVWKFRTMTTSEDGCTAATYHQVRLDDERVTRFGRFLRRSSLDELPQFVNVLAGSMSIVGPRPHALAVNEQCRKLIPRYMLRHKVKPGITGWAQVNGCRGGDDLDALRDRTECDLQYIKTWSVGLDLLIMWRTARLLALGDKRAF